MTAAVRVDRSERNGSDPADSVLTVRDDRPRRPIRLYVAAALIGAAACVFVAVFAGAGGVADSPVETPRTHASAIEYRRVPHDPAECNASPAPHRDTLSITWHGYGKPRGVLQVEPDSSGMLSVAELTASMSVGLRHSSSVSRLELGVRVADPLGDAPTPKCELVQTYDIGTHYVELTVGELILTAGCARCPPRVLFRLNETDASGVAETEYIGSMALVDSRR